MYRFGFMQWAQATSKSSEAKLKLVPELAILYTQPDYNWEFV